MTAASRRRSCTASDPRARGTACCSRPSAGQGARTRKGWGALGWEINEDIINVMGGSIAIGHPFGATGTRLVTTLANEMARRDVQFGLLSICAQGGMGLAMVLERR